MTRNWELNVQFKVHGKAKELFGDGLVLWYVKDRMVQGPVFGSKDYFSGLAIILDTYSNHNGPHNVTEIEHPFEAVFNHLINFYLILFSISIRTSVRW